MKKICVAAAGTGGHVLPAFRFAKYAKDQGMEIVWVGGRREIEKRYAEKINAKFHSLSVTGIRGKNFYYTIKSLVNLVLSTAVCVYYFCKEKPDFVIVFGGYISIPVGIAKLNFLGLPLANESISRAEIVGNPIGYFMKKTELNNLDRIKIYVTGGSLGSDFINSNIPSLLADFSDRIKVVHQCGNGYKNKTKARYQGSIDAEVIEFIEEPLEKISWSDFVISRAGALTLSELIALGKPGIIIPLPSAIDNHQFFNAKYFSKIGMGFLFQENEDINKLQKFLVAMIVEKQFKNLCYTNEQDVPSEHLMLKRILNHG
jgi:UDP-N-acetylglucosamine--N-acetylmuramyl-(pentapeptide) pyrophosphoryl-undecaprenol N-acetylglucosamine transferase